jgi:hypothetical protein
MDCMSQLPDRNVVIHRASESLASKSLSVLEPSEMPNAEKEEVLMAAIAYPQVVGRQKRLKDREPGGVSKAYAGARGESG